MMTFLRWLPWLLAVGIMLYVILAGLFAVWAESEERRQEAERQRFERIMAAGRPRIFNAKGPKGFRPLSEAGMTVGLFDLRCRKSLSGGV